MIYLSSKRVKVNIRDIADDLDSSNKIMKYVNKRKVYNSSKSSNSSKSRNKNSNYNHKAYKHYSHRHFSPFLNKITNTIRENKNGFKDDFDRVMNSSYDKIDSFDLEKYREISELPRTIVDEVLLSTNSFYNKVKYEKNKDNGREIKIEKKD